MLCWCDGVLFSKDSGRRKPPLTFLAAWMLSVGALQGTRTSPHSDTTEAEEAAAGDERGQRVHRHPQRLPA